VGVSDEGIATRLFDMADADADGAPGSSEMRPAR
jgi:hypothetical protein